MKPTTPSVNNTKKKTVKASKNPRTIAEMVEEKFDYYIEQRHCRETNPKRQLRDMCRDCRDINYHIDTLKKIKKQVLAVLNNKSL